MQAELLLISRDEKAIAHYLPRLRRCANFIESRRDPQNNLFLAGPAGNLLAPSYAGWKKPDGTYDKAYLAGLSITYIAALDRLIELEKLAGNAETVKLYTTRRDLARKGLPLLTTDEGYFIKYLDPDGTRHGVYGAEQHGYFEAVSNHDAICFRVADDSQAEKIYQKIASIPGLRPHDFIITNCPGLDDMYTPPTELAVEVRHLGQRRPLVHLRSPHGDGLLPAGQVRRRPALDAAVDEVRPPVPHGQSAGRLRRPRLPAEPADQPVLRQLRAAGGDDSRAVRVPVPGRRAGAPAAHPAGHHAA